MLPVTLRLTLYTEHEIRGFNANKGSYAMMVMHEKNVVHLLS
jgi:hypothetical protein